MKGIELFAGSGGLALAAKMAGIQHTLLLEWNKSAMSTLRQNAQYFSGSEMLQDDIRNIEFKCLEGKVDIISGGPPCQPFSLAGKHMAFRDERDLFMEFRRAVFEIKPKVFVIENVKGLIRSSFADYFSYLLLSLRFPSIKINDKEWEESFSSLQKIQNQNSHVELKYNLSFRLLNGVEFGSPQSRERVVIVGFRDDIDVSWSFPKKTHSLDALLSKYATSSFPIAKLIVPEKIKEQVEKLKAFSINDTSLNGYNLPYNTTRDAIYDIINKDSVLPNHTIKQGGKVYPGHSGSYLDMPAKTLKAGVHGVPGGENMFIGDDLSPRYFTVREAARLQGYPDDYFISGSWTEGMRQIGNSISIDMFRHIFSSITKSLQ